MLSLLRVWTVRELRGGWRVLAAISALIVLASALLALAPVFRDASADRALERLLEQQSPALFRNRIERIRQPATAEAAAALDADLARASQDRLPGLTGAPARLGLSTAGSLDLQPSAFGARFQLFQDLDDHVLLTSGRFANEARTADGQIAVMIGESAAAGAGIVVGDRLTFTLAGSSGQTAEVEVVGIIAPRVPRAAAFHESDGWFQLVPMGLAPPTVGLFVEPETMFSAVAADLPAVRLDYFVNQPIDLSSLNSDDVAPARRTLEAYALQLRQTPGTVVSTPIARTLRTFELEARFSATPLLLIALQMAAVAAFAIALLGVQFAKRSEADRRRLRARGAGAWQAIRVHSLIGLLIALPAAALGAPLAAFALSQAGRTSALDAITDGAPLATRLSPEAWLLGLAGAGIAWLSFTAPVWLQTRERGAAGRRGILRARPSISIIHRAYLDIALLIVALILFRQFDVESQQNQFSALGGDSVDPVLLISPGLLLAAIALVLARILPPILNRLAALTAQARLPVWVSLSLISLARDPARPMSLLALGLFVAASGTIAATYSQTFDATTLSRASYEVGADLRAVAISPAIGRAPDESVAAIAGRPDVRQAGAAARVLGKIGIDQAGAKATLLAVQPERFDDLVAFRPDFADDSLAAIFAAIRADPSPPGLALPNDTQSLALWVRTDPPDAAITLEARVIDGNGEPRTVALGQPSAEGWQRLVGPLALPAPVRLVGLAFSASESGVRAPAGRLWFDDLVAITEGGETVIEPFDDAPPWFSIGGDVPGGDRVSSEAAASRDNGIALRYDWTRLESGDLRVLLRDSPNLPVPVALGSAAMRAAGIREGDVIPFTLAAVTIPLRVVKTIELFPTLDPANGGIIVADVDAVLDATAALSRSRAVVLTEIWIDLTRADAAGAVAGLLDTLVLPTVILDQGALLEERLSDPFNAGGAGGLFLVGFGALLIITLVTITLTFASAADERRQPIALLRTMGYQSRTAAIQAAAEMASLLTLGGLAGVLIGRAIARVLLAFLNVTVDGGRAVPPLVLETDWTIAALGLIGLLAGAVLIVLVLARASAGRRVAEVVRLHEI